MTVTCFLEPLDVLYLRGNKLFGGPGEHGAALMPPWPSVAAGAMRAQLWARGIVPEVLQDPEQFRLLCFAVARRTGRGIEVLTAPPADLAVQRDDVRYLRPQALPSALRTSYARGLKVPVLRQAKQEKSEGGYWLNGAGFEAYLKGALLDREKHLIRTSALWRLDQRLGIALDTAKRSAAEGALYTAECVAMEKDTGFAVACSGEAAARLLVSSTIRFGGDGRAVRMERCDIERPEPDWDRIKDEKHFRIVLASPGIFPHGWRLPGLDENLAWRGPEGCSARLVAAAMPRAQVISGWDLARWSQGKSGPKPAMRAAPAGSVYWFEGLEGGIEGLRKLAEEGFWAQDRYPDASRRSEGFNHVFIAAWPHD